MLRSILIAVITLCSVTAHAGFDEGMAAYDKKDYATVLKEWTPVALHGDAVAQYNLGIMYQNGQGVQQNNEEAVKWYRLAADQGYANAQNNLGGMYQNGHGVPQDYKEAMKWHRLAADQGNAVAQFHVGMSYDKGEGVPKDYKEAMKWLKLAADNGHVMSQFKIALMYTVGDEGVPKDEKEAVKWYLLAANHGLADAQEILGLWYEVGHGVLQDFEEAVKWYRLAADQGEASAQNRLGSTYANGRGIHQSRVIAFALFNVSATNNPSTENPATSNREKLTEEMSPAEINAGQALSREMIKSGNLLNALEKYSKKPTVKEKIKISSADSDLSGGGTSSNGAYPSRPAKRAGVTSCNTRCNNADCYRTYDDGHKLHFQAKQKFNPISGQFEWDSGSC